MNAGRELDALVAEKVMGTEKPSREFAPHPYSSNTIHTSRCWHWHYGENDWLPMPYSADIAAAWETVEAMAAKHSTLKLFSPGARMNDEHDVHATRWAARFYSWGPPWGPSGPTCEGESAPHAICLAALKAVGAL